MKINPKHLIFDTTILQSRTVGNITAVLEQAINSNNREKLKLAVKFVLNKRIEATTKYENRAFSKDNKRTTVDSRIEFLGNNKDNI